MNLKNKILLSAKEMKNVRSLTLMAMLLAMRIVLSIFCSIQLGETLKIGLSFIATALMGLLFGPISAGIVSGVGDIVQIIIKPSGGFFPGWTISAILGGVIYGLLLYKTDFSSPKNYIPRIIIAKSMINILINAFLGTFWLKISLGKVMSVIFLPRLIKNLSLLPIEITILCIVVPFVANITKKLRVAEN